MLWRGCGRPTSLRLISTRRKFALVIVFAVIVCIHPWYSSTFQLTDDTMLITNKQLSEYKAILSHNYKTTAKEIKPSVISHDEDFPYRYLINEPEFCSDRSDLYIINVVGSAPWEIKSRSKIRGLWANEAYRNLTGFSTVFIIGQTPDQKIMNDLKVESNKYHDILLLDIEDSYANLTLKTLVMFHWVDKFCSNAYWTLKSDSDVFVNSFALSRYLHAVQESGKSTLVCKKRRPVSPCRNCRHAKWRVPWSEYPKDKFPEYCMGPGYVIPREIIRPIYDAANKTHPFRIEDVYYTGILPQNIKIGNKKHNIKSRFPWRPTSWQNSFVFGDLMILELDKRLGRGASSLVWSNILKNRGLIKEVDGKIQGQFKNVIFKAPEQ